MSSPPRDVSRSKRRRFLCSALLAALALLLALPEVAGQTPRKAVTTSPSALPLRVARPASGAYAGPGDDPSSLARHKWKDHKWKDHHEAERDDDDDDDDDDDRWDDHGVTGTPTPASTSGGVYDGVTSTPTPASTSGGDDDEGVTGTPTPASTPGGVYDGVTSTPTPASTSFGDDDEGVTGTPTLTAGGDGIPYSGDTDMTLSDATLVDRVCDPSTSAADVWLAVLEHADADADGALDYAEFRALVAKSMGSSVWKNEDSSSGAHHHETKRPTRTQTPMSVAPRPGSAVRASSGRKGKGKDPLRREWACDATVTVEDKVRALFEAMDDGKPGIVGFGDGDDERLEGVPFLVSMVTMQYLANALE